MSPQSFLGKPLIGGKVGSKQTEGGEKEARKKGKEVEKRLLESNELKKGHTKVKSEDPKKCEVDERTTGEDRQEKGEIKQTIM